MIRDQAVTFLATRSKKIRLKWDFASLNAFNYILSIPMFETSPESRGTGAGWLVVISANKTMISTS
jgi:hypothetical protein